MNTNEILLRMHLLLVLGDLKPEQVASANEPDSYYHGGLARHERSEAPSEVLVPLSSTTCSAWLLRLRRSTERQHRLRVGLLWLVDLEGASRGWASSATRDRTGVFAGRAV